MVGRVAFALVRTAAVDQVEVLEPVATGNEQSGLAFLQLLFELLLLGGATGAAGQIAQVHLDVAQVQVDAGEETTRPTVADRDVVNAHQAGNLLCLCVHRWRDQCANDASGCAYVQHLLACEKCGDSQAGGLVLLDDVVIVLVQQAGHRGGHVDFEQKL